VTEIIQLNLTPEEEAALRHSAEQVRLILNEVRDI
jgi:malate/lactate dehydrogenase